MLATFRFYASGSHVRVIGDTLNIHISSVSRSITVVTTALLRIAHHFIKLPDPDQIEEIKRKVYKRGGLPGIVGFVDGTHIKLQRPIGELDAQYICRKGYPSLNVMAMCDDKRRFCYVMAKHPGSAHDSMVMRSSKLVDIAEAVDLGGIILGDSGYALSPWLFTPIMYPKNATEEDYNRRHKHCRVLVEQAFGILERRWICTHSEMRLAPGKVVQIVIVCCMLHNIAIDVKLARVGLADSDSDDEDDLEDVEVDVDDSDESDDAVESNVATWETGSSQLHSSTYLT